ncbi:hypothetical protein LJR235_002885 [Pararhizobium sp. LjRoot235]|uniref:hypothetical protein n=1 Tax=Pararhizobium sp. LjRoot235 TaxID=3342291 RepID=UPI003ED12436
MNVYSRLQATAKRLIEKYGQTGTGTRLVNAGTSYDPTQTPATFSCQLVVLDYEDSRVDGALIKRSDKMIYVSTAGLTSGLEQSDKIAVGTDEYSIVSLKPLNPAGTIVYWEVQGRR